MPDVPGHFGVKVYYLDCSRKPSPFTNCQILYGGRPKGYLDIGSLFKEKHSRLEQNGWAVDWRLGDDLDA